MDSPRFSFTRPDLYDPITGVYQRWYLELRVDEELSRSLRTGNAITLISMQVERSRAQAIGQRLKLQMRDYDLVGHLGRGRFVVVVLDAAQAEASSVVARLQHVIDAAPDMGLAWFPDDDITFEGLLQSAEQRLLNDAKAA